MNIEINMVKKYMLMLFSGRNKCKYAALNKGKIKN
jgi:thioredoxin-related protein